MMRARWCSATWIAGRDSSRRSASARNEPLSTKDNMKVLGISGSLRKGSYNAMALRTAQKLAPHGMTIEIADIAAIPLYNDDVRAAGDPAPVAALKAQIRAADAVLL